MHVLILGATSALAAATARQFADRGADLTLAGRNQHKLEEQARDLQLRYGVAARTAHFDALDIASHRGFVDSLPSLPDVAVLAFGLMSDQQQAEQDFDRALLMLQTNITGAASVLELLAAPMARRGSGGLIGVSSVAGLRGRASNYAYGASKAALTAWLSGMRNRLHASGVRVMTVLPGFMDTPMTEGLDLPAALTATPEEAARDLVRGWEKGKDVVYTKWMWRWIMLVIRLLPESVFKRTSL